MSVIPLKLRASLSVDPEYKVCARSGLHGHVCAGGITWEHAIIYAGRKVQERWAIIPLCEFGHSINRFQDGGDLKKEINIWIALNRASDDELRAISKVVDYIYQRNYLNSKYGVYVCRYPVDKVGTVSG